jgi:Xaa-Pro aminopeptidase
MDRVRLFIDQSQLTPEVLAHLDGVEICAYTDILPAVQSLETKGKVWIDFSTVNYALTSALPVRDNVVDKPSPIVLAKAVKNDVELQGMRNAHARDATACIKFFNWLQQRLESGDTSLTEVSVSEKLKSYRSAVKDFVTLSFDTISGVGSNGAIIHYHPQEDSCATLNTKEMYLCDSGGQYRDGTTDITRTFHFGTPTDHERRCFTRVLQGHIAIASAVFPSGTHGHSIDAFARQFLWMDGLDYEHGTGHGVGAFLNVHEGPHGISKQTRAQGIIPGMIVSNEPGYYEEGKFGIRIESLVVAR